MPEQVAPNYRAFISYSHADTSVAQWLHRELEGFRVDKDLAGRETKLGSVPKTLRPIFRDREDFTAGHTLADQTLAALDGSAALIVICSQSSAKSYYVNEEVRLFRSRHPDRPVIPMIVGGKPDDAELDCFPRAIKFKVNTRGEVTDEPAELLAADIRDEGDGKNLAVAKVVAALLGLSSDEVFRRAERERRAATHRKRRTQAVVAGLLAMLALAWFNQDFLRQRFYWTFRMGPTVLTEASEQQLKPKDEFKECSNGCPAMLVLPTGNFMMGGAQFDSATQSDYPKHEVSITRPYAVGKYEVTLAEWDVCVAAGACAKPKDADPRHGDLPVTDVSWDEAQQYVAWLSRMTGKPYRLLTESEWEYAARAGRTSRYTFGDGENGIDEYIWYHGNTKRSQPVGQKKPNAFGLHDIDGNVREWVEDVWHDNYKGAPADGSAWLEGESSTRRVLRGGSWNYGIEQLRSVTRAGSYHSYRFDSDGFRIARTLRLGADAGTPFKATHADPLVALRLSRLYRIQSTGLTGAKHTAMLALTEGPDDVSLTYWLGSKELHATGHIVGDKLLVHWPGTESFAAQTVTYGWGNAEAVTGKWPGIYGADATAELVAVSGGGHVPAPDGFYRVEGKNPSGSSYAGTVIIMSRDGSYHLTWEVGDSVYEGRGTIKDKFLTVEWESVTPIVYALGADGRLSGLWDSGRGEERLSFDMDNPLMRAKTEPSAPRAGN